MRDPMCRIRRCVPVRSQGCHILHITISKSRTPRRPGDTQTSSCDIGTSGDAVASIDRTRVHAEGESGNVRKIIPSLPHWC